MRLKRGGLVLTFLVLFVMLFSFGFVVAENHFDSVEEDLDDVFDGFDEDLFEELGEEYGDAVLVDPGLTPDSAFYFIDEFFDRFGNDLDNREEKIAELRAMIEEGNFEAARKALESYKKHAEEWEENADPAERERARRSAAAIHRSLLEFEDEIPDDLHGEFFDDVLERESGLITAVEISSKIKDLCEALSELDPLEYSRVCRTDEGDAEWHKNLDKDLTDAQIAEAKEFGKIMSECFATSGGTCRCEDISFTAFAEQCSIIAPLAYACDVLDDEFSCDEMDRIEDENDPFDLLPDYLHDVLDDIEDQYEDDQYDNHIPGACRDAGITGEERGDRDRCFKIMIEEEAPRPCTEAVKDGRIKITNERAFREACEAIMFEEEAPFECIEAGLTDFRECGVLMFKLNAPQECIDAGLTGDHRSDERACREIAGGDFGDGGGPGFGFDCGRIESAVERLDCYDQASQGAYERFDDRRSFDERYEDTIARERQCAETCSAEGGAWDFSGGECTCRFYDHDEYRDDYDGEPSYDCSIIDCFEGQYCDPYQGCVQDDFGSDAPFDCSVMFCVTGSYCDPYQGCVSDGGRDDIPNGEYDCSQLNCGTGFFCNSQEGCYPDNSNNFNDKSSPDYDPSLGGDGVSCNDGYESDGSGGCIPFGTGDYGFDDVLEEPVPEPEPTPEPTDDASSSDDGSGGDGTTGAVVSDFYDYYYR